MSQIFTKFPFLPTWYYFNTFLYHVAFWDDLREFKVEILNFKQAPLFFFWKTEWPIFKHVFRAIYAFFWGNWRRKELFYEKGLNFQKIEPNFYYEEAFSRYRYANIPYFLTFFQCFACNWPTRCEPIFSKFLSEIQTDALYHNVQLQVHTCTRTLLIIKKKVKKQLYLDDFQTFSPTPGFSAPDITH